MLLLLWTSCFSEPPARADLVVLADQGVVVVDSRIESVHANPKGVLDRFGADTTVIEGARVTPGFVDAHAHPVSLGRSLEQLDLTGIDTYAETLGKVRVAATQGTGWLVGRGWDQNDWSDAPPSGWPTASELDGVTGQRPALLTRIDGHAVWANTAALTAAGIGADTVDPAGGEVVRDASGRPTGVLIDAAMALVEPAAPTPEDLSRFALAGASHMARAGLTGVQVMGIDDLTLGALEELAASGSLPIRMWIYVAPDTQAASRLAATGPWEVGLSKVVGVKLYADGALGSRGALLSEDYADRPGHRGLAVLSDKELAEVAVRVTASGGQVAIHAIGDLGVRHALDAVAAVRAAHPGHAAVRHRVEHAQVVHPDDVARFTELNVVASMQPTHATSDMPWAQARLGEERLPWAYAWRTLEDASVVLAFGSDAPVESASPAAGLWAAITRTDPSGAPAGGWTMAEAVSEERAVAAFTQGAALAVHDEEALGRIEPGLSADLTIWTVDGARWTAVATIVAGEAVWRAEQAP
ncbi:MAG: amidohydrolase [Myxococcales bacterium]|nr:amidohydrolase [Myxococcales bacterium]